MWKWRIKLNSPRKLFQLKTNHRLANTFYFYQARSLTTSRNNGLKVNRQTYTTENITFAQTKHSSVNNLLRVARYVGPGILLYSMAGSAVSGFHKSHEYPVIMLNHLACKVVVPTSAGLYLVPSDIIQWCLLKLGFPKVSKNLAVLSWSWAIPRMAV